jgi:hypothetical protein
MTMTGDKEFLPPDQISLDQLDCQTLIERASADCKQKQKPRNDQQNADGLAPQLSKYHFFESNGQDQSADA